MAAGQEGYDFVGSYGGDGTLHEVVTGIAASDGPPVLILPGGTGNAVADDLGVPSSLSAAVALITGDHELRPLDLGRMGDRYFALGVTMGLEADMVTGTTPDMKARLGWFAYGVSGLRALSAEPVAHYRVEVDGRLLEEDGLALLIANSANTGVAGVSLAAGVDVSDGLLDVVIIQPADLPALLGSAVDAVRGQEPRSLCHWQGTSIQVHSEPAQAVLCDGEDAGRTPVEVEIAPSAVSVVVPVK
jgi:diacylglycerol kinase (ATP)